MDPRFMISDSDIVTACIRWENGEFMGPTPIKQLLEASDYKTVVWSMLYAEKQGLIVRLETDFQISHSVATNKGRKLVGQPLIKKPNAS